MNSVLAGVTSVRLRVATGPWFSLCRDPVTVDFVGGELFKQFDKRPLELFLRHFELFNG